MVFRDCLSTSLLPALVWGIRGLASQGYAGDQAQWGTWGSRNMVSGETGLPSSFDPESGENVKWSVSLGNNGFGTPVIANGKVLVGANNEMPRDPRHQGDRAVLLCLNEADGSLCWQLVVPRIGDDIYKDWPKVSICSPPTVEGDRVYVMTNRFEVVCLDLKGQADGNDGPYLDEGRHMAPADQEPMAVTPMDADIIWLFDVLADAGTYPHDSAHSSILLDGANLYLNTCNGVDNTHVKIRRPEGPSLIVLDKMTGRLVAKDNEGIGPRVFHSSWSSPSLGEIDGRRLVFFGGGDGVCYAFDALDPAGGGDKALTRVWRFDGDPTAPKEDVHQYNGNRRESPSNIYGMPVFHKGRIYVAGGGDYWWGKEEAWLTCIDATQTGEITESGAVWSYPLNEHVFATPSLHDGMVFIGDCSGVLHCVDAETGDALWAHDLGRDIWASALVADGKIYVGTYRGEFWVFAAEREKRLISKVRCDAPIAATPAAANGVLYLATLERLYALQAPVAGG